MKDLELAISDEYGVHFETGVPVTFRYLRNTERAPNFGSKFGQDIEPAGRYMLHNHDPGHLSRGWESGEITFRHPLVIPLSGDRYNIYGPTGWKARLRDATGKTGVSLTRHLKSLGYDGIVTVDPDGYTREIVDITQEPQVKHKRNPSERESFKAMIARHKREREQAIEEIAAALAVSPAITAGHGARSDLRTMVIVSGEPSDHEYGKFRATYFGDDGPHGHVTRHTMEDIYDEIQRSYSPPFRPMTEDEVIAWTNTDKFITGSKVTAFVQADNTLRYRAHQLGRYDWAADISRKANALGVERVDEALAMLEAALRELPTPNPPRALVANPPWITKVLADSYEVLDDKVPARWLPQLAAVHHRGRTNKGLTADLVEFGCGAYGCVLATNDPDTVLKVTSDETEAEFAAQLAPSLVAPVCVDYRMVVRVARKHHGRQVHLLWRESAEHVGDIDHVLDRGYQVERAIRSQHEAGQIAFQAFYVDGARAGEIYAKEWLEHVHIMGERVPELRELADGLQQVWDQQRILFGDIHSGNLGMVTRNGRKVWVITDPGNVAVLRSPDH